MCIRMTATRPTAAPLRDGRSSHSPRVAGCHIQVARRIRMNMSTQRVRSNRFAVCVRARQDCIYHAATQLSCTATDSVVCRHVRDDAFRCSPAPRRSLTRKHCGCILGIRQIWPTFSETANSAGPTTRRCRSGHVPSCRTWPVYDYGAVHNSSIVHNSGEEWTCT
jgi:hypothetical protein